MTTHLLFAPEQAFANGVFAPGAQAVFYLSGTTTPVTVYSDPAYTTPHPSPLEADAAGRFAQVFYPDASEVRCIITTSTGASIADVDPVPLAKSTGSAADELSFTPVTDNPATDVQAAIAANTLNKAPLASPALTGTPTAPTAAADTNTTQLATAAFVQQEIGNNYDGVSFTVSTLASVSTAIPAGVSEIVIGFDEVDAVTTDILEVTVGTGSTVQTTGYAGSSQRIISAGSVIDSNQDSGNFYIYPTAGDLTGTMTIRRMIGTSNAWVGTHFFNTSNIAVHGSSSVTLSGELDIVQIKPTGADTFDNGLIHISWRK